MALTLTSTAFSHGARVPKKYTCDGDTISPPLTITAVPKGTMSLVLIMEDPDLPKELYPNGGTFDHWILFNIPPDTTVIPEGKEVGIQGKNSVMKNSYAGPCPPPHYEPKEHRYFFRIWALDNNLSLQEGASKNELLVAMQGHILATTELMGRYARA